MRRQTIIGRYETPDALRHDARRLVEDAQALMEATAQVADEKVVQARKRLAAALESGQQAYDTVRERMVESARAADRAVHEHPYPTLTIAFGLGALIGLLLRRR
jgi:ElaB/YqjD/DUF883 family membrane-anchored ribosome-binding protein